MELVSYSLVIIQSGSERGRVVDPDHAPAQTPIGDSGGTRV